MGNVYTTLFQQVSESTAVPQFLAEIVVPQGYIGVLRDIECTWQPNPGYPEFNYLQLMGGVYVMARFFPDAHGIVAHVKWEGRFVLPSDATVLLGVPGTEVSLMVGGYLLTLP